MRLVAAQPDPAAVAAATVAAGSVRVPPSPWHALTLHWREYAMEAAGLGIFMVSACLFGAVYENPASLVRQVLPWAMLRRILMGLSMGLTAITIVYSPWGKQSGAHINPSVTLTFFQLGKIQKWDALFYMVAQFAGALLGVTLMALLLGKAISDPTCATL